MAGNKMNEVAKLLGVELEEEFKVYGWDGFCKITELGLERNVKERSWFTDSIMLMDLIKGTEKIIKIPKPILDEKEKEYLSNFLKPYRKRIDYIEKSSGHPNGKQWIYISLDKNNDDISLPYFTPNTMYKGMVINRRYTLEELGL